jgi:hypothetical protein
MNNNVGAHMEDNINVTQEELINKAKGVERVPTERLEPFI